MRKKFPDQNGVKYETRGRPRLNPWTAASLRERADAYFRKCDKATRVIIGKDGEEIMEPHAIPYTIEGLCRYLKVTRKEFRKWMQEESEIGREAELIYETIIADRVEGGLAGRINASFARFTLFNQDPSNFREKVEVENSVSPAAAGVLQSWLHGWERRTLLGSTDEETKEKQDK